MSTDRAEVGAGALRVAMHYRNDIPGDAGLCIEVWAPVDGDDTELLRFDCFAVAPHYHYGPAAGDERLMFDATADGDPLQWTLERFERGHLPAMIARAGYPQIGAAVDGAAVAAALPEIASLAEAIVQAQAS